MEYRRFLFCLIWTCSCVAVQTSPQYELKGKEATLIPAAFGRPETILWKHNGNKVVEFTGSEEEVYSPFKKRVTLNWESAELSIKDLRFNDSGEYELEVDVDNMLKRSFHKLMVIDRVAKPTITCTMIDSNSSAISDKQAVLVCSAETGPFPSLVNFKWKSVGKVQPGPELTIPLGEKHNEDVYNCSVSNPLSEDMATFTAKNCYPDEGSSVPWIVVAVISVIILAILILFLFLAYHFRERLKVIFPNCLAPECCVKKRPVDVESQKLHVGTRGKDEIVEDRNAGTQGITKANKEFCEALSTELKNKRMNSQLRTHSPKKKTGIVDDQNAATQEGRPEEEDIKSKIQRFESLSPNCKKTGQNDGQPGKYSPRKRTELEQNLDQKEENKFLFPPPYVAQTDQDLESEYPAPKHSAAESDQNHLLASETVSDVKLIHSEPEKEADEDDEREPLLGSGAAPEDLNSSVPNMEHGDTANEDKKDSAAEIESSDSEETKEPAVNSKMKDDVIKSSVEASTSLQEPGIVDDQNAATQEGRPKEGYIKSQVQLFESLSPNCKKTGQNDGQPGKYSARKRTELEQNPNQKEENKFLFPQPYVVETDQDLKSEYPAPKHSAAESDQNHLLASETVSDVKLIHSEPEKEADEGEEREPCLSSGAAPEDSGSEETKEPAVNSKMKDDVIKSSVEASTSLQEPGIVDDQNAATQEGRPEEGDVKSKVQHFESFSPNCKKTGQNNDQPGKYSPKKTTELEQNPNQKEENKFLFPQPYVAQTDQDLESEYPARKHSAAESDQNHLLASETVSDVKLIHSEPEKEADEGEEKEPLLGSGAAPEDLNSSVPNVEHGNTANEDKKDSAAEMESSDSEETKEPAVNSKMKDDVIKPSVEASTSPQDPGSGNEVNTHKVTEARDDPNIEPEDASSECREEAASDKVTEVEGNVRESHLLHRSGDSLEEKHSDLLLSSQSEPSEKDANTDKNTTGLTPETHTSVSEDEKKSDTVVDLEETSKDQNLSESPGIHTEEASVIVHVDQNMPDGEHEGENTRGSDEECSQSDSSRAKGDKGEDRNEAQAGPPEKEPETLTEDKEGQNKAEVGV